MKSSHIILVMLIAIQEREGGKIVGIVLLPLLNPGIHQLSRCTRLLLRCVLRFHRDSPHLLPQLDKPLYILPPYHPPIVLVFLEDKIGLEGFVGCSLRFFVGFLDGKVGLLGLVGCSLRFFVGFLHGKVGLLGLHLLHFLVHITFILS